MAAVTFLRRGSSYSRKRAIPRQSTYRYEANRFHERACLLFSIVLLLTPAVLSAQQLSQIPIIDAPLYTPGLGGGLVIADNIYRGDQTYRTLVPLYLYEGKYLFAHGTSIGAQLHSQIILFKDAASMQWFKQKHVEFVGRASAVAFKLGTAVNPAYNPGVAVFSLSKGGLMVEASAGGVYLSYRSLDDERQ